MTLSGRPLLDTRPDSQLFVDRVEEMSRVRAALNHSLNCLVVGERGSGKTSLLRALMFQSRQDGDHQERRPPDLAYVHAAGAGGAAGLLARAPAARPRDRRALPPRVGGGRADPRESAPPVESRTRPHYIAKRAKRARRGHGDTGQAGKLHPGARAQPALIPAKLSTGKQVIDLMTGIITDGITGVA